MEGYVVSAYTKDKNRLYLSSTDIIDFSDSINDSKLFESIESAKSTLDDRYLSLSYWILNTTKNKDLDGIYINRINNMCLLWEGVRYL